jgi:PAS domain S-box-containing protein
MDTTRMSTGGSPGDGLAGPDPPGLADSEERFKLLVEGVREYALYLLDDKGIIASWNTGAERLKGYRADEVVGRSFSMFFTTEDVAASRPQRELDIAAREGSYREEGWRVRKDGERFWASVVVSALRAADGRLRGFAKVTADRTERRLAEETLRRSEESLAATLDSIGDAVIVTDGQGCVTRLNPVAERLTGWTHADAAGRTLPEVFHIINEDTRRLAENPVERVLREGLVVGLANHTALVSRDGAERPIADSGAPVRGLDGAVQGAVLVFRDVSEERAAERALRESEERFRLLVEGVTDHALTMLDADGRVASWNSGAARIEGYLAEEVIGQPIDLFYTDEDRRAGAPARALETARRLGRIQQEGWRVRKDGGRFWANVVTTAVHDEGGELRGFAQVTQDFTERRHAEETARRLEVEQAARRAAEQAEAQLRESEERYRQQSEQLAIILAGVADGVTAQASDGRLLYANDAAARICGFDSAEALVQASPAQVMSRFEVLDETGAALSSQHLPGRRALAGEPHASALVQVREKSSGGRWWSAITATAVRDRGGKPYLAVNIWRDVTAQRRTEEAARFLSEAGLLLAAGLDSRVTLDRLARLAVPSLADWCSVELVEGERLVPVAVAHVDPARVIMARELRERYPPDQNAASGAPQVARTGTSELYPDISDELIARGARDAEHLEILRAVGLRSAMIVPVAAPGRVLGVLTLIAAESDRRYDQTDLALAEELGRRAGLALENARLYREATEAIKVRDEFLSVAGHELKTPLAALLLQLASLLRLVRRPGTVDLVRLGERLEKTVGHGARLERLIDQLLDVSRITSGRLRLDRETVDLAEVTAEVIARFADESARAGSPIELGGGPARGQWDRQRLDQVVTNLVSNALKYGAGNPVRVQVRPEPGDRVALQVTDRGIGIALEHQRRIFERFERAVSDRSYGGLGLGLWITRQIVEAHGGEILVQSEPGRGATFTVVLPC